MDVKAQSLPSLHVHGSFARLLLTWLDKHRLSATGLRSVINSYSMVDTLPLSEWQMLLNQAQEIRPRASVGLEIGACISLEHTGLLGYLLLGCDTVGQVFNVYERFESLFYGARICEVREVDGDLEIGWPSIGPRQTSLLMSETAISSLVTFSRQLAPQAPGPLQVRFPSVQSSHGHAHEAFFKCPVQFGARYLAVRYPLAVVGWGLPGKNPALATFLNRQSAGLDSIGCNSDPFIQEVQRVILHLLPEARAELGEVASVLCMSPRTLQRRLAAQSQTFQSLLQNIRLGLGKSYLQDKSLSLAEVGILLGYSEQSAFNRAFKKWTAGETPGIVRRRSA